MASKKIYACAPCGKVPVCDVFYDHFYNLQLPEGSHRSRARMGTVAANLNVLVDAARGGGFDYIFIVEDDSIFAPDTVLRLLSHDKDVVAGLCISRQHPFLPYIYNAFENGDVCPRQLTADDKGLIHVAATGMGGILIKTSVFDKLTKPYFYTTFEGEVEWGQDILFAKKLVAAGIEVFCDTDVTIWHSTHCVVAAIRGDNGWETVIRVNNHNVIL